MPANSNFQQAIREAQSSALIGPNVVNKALPYVGRDVGFVDGNITELGDVCGTPGKSSLFFLTAYYPGTLLLFP
jgi:hypothetical protein